MDMAAVIGVEPGMVTRALCSGLGSCTEYSWESVDYPHYRENIGIVFTSLGMVSLQG